MTKISAPRLIIFFLGIAVLCGLGSEILPVLSTVAGICILCVLACYFGICSFHKAVQLVMKMIIKLPIKTKKCQYCGGKIDHKTQICYICKSGGNLQIYEESPSVMEPKEEKG